MATSETVFIGLGSNLGESSQLLQEGWELLGLHPGVTLATLSAPYLSSPVGMASNFWFTNAVGQLTASCSADEMLDLLLVTEKQLGRVRDDNKRGYQDREIDLDLLYFGDTGMKPWQFMLVQSPFTLVAVGAGYLFLVHRHVDELAVTTPEGKAAGQRLAYVLLPLVFVVCAVLLLPPVLAKAQPALSEGNRSMLSMLVGLLVGLVVIVWDENRRGKGVRIFSSLLKPKSRSILLTIAGVMVFENLLGTSGLVEVASTEMQASNIGLICTVSFLPFLAGLITGVAVGFVGASLPLVVGLITPESGLTPVATLVLSYGCGYMGMMLSPVHVCFLVTKDYYRASLFRSYLLLLKPAVAVMAGATVLFFLSRLG